MCDEEVILLRRPFKQCIDAVKNGQDPVGVVRDYEKMSASI
jgi:hypothetical protein